MVVNRNRQAGRTLIELLVAITLGLLIMTGVSSLHVTSTQTSRSMNAIAQAEEQGNTLLYVLGAAIKRAGYGEILGTVISANQAQANQDNLMYTGPAMRGCSNGRFTDPENNDFSCAGLGAGDAGDALAIWFQADNVLTVPQGNTANCLGGAAAMTVPANPSAAAMVMGAGLPVVNNAYWIQNGTLFCRGFNPNGAEDPPQSVVSGVLDFKIFYGFDEQGYANPAALADRPAGRRIVDAAFLNALPTVGDLSPWDFVVSAHVCLLLRTQETGVSAQPTAQILPCPQTAEEAADTVVPVANPVPGAVVRAYSQVFTVRSRATPSPMRPT